MMMMDHVRRSVLKTSRRGRQLRPLQHASAQRWLLHDYFHQLNISVHHMLYLWTGENNNITYFCKLRSKSLRVQGQSKILPSSERFLVSALGDLSIKSFTKQKIACRHNPNLHELSRDVPVAK
jgi:hypothetical protein